MVKLRKTRLLIFCIVVVCLFFGINACKKKESMTERIKTVADKPLPLDGFKAEINALNPRLH